MGILEWEIILYLRENSGVDLTDIKTYKFILRRCLLPFIFLSLSFPLFGQGGFHLPPGEKRARIPFRLINNLLVVKAKVNGTELSFLLDSGASASILFSSIDSLYLRDTTSIKIKGLDAKKTIRFLKSDHNTVRLGQAVDSSHTLFVGYDNDFSLRMGIPVNGVLGNDFFRNLIVEVNYETKKITVYRPGQYRFSHCRRCEDMQIRFAAGKPLIKLSADFGNIQKELVLLVDSGNSDALWLFDQDLFITEDPKNYFEDHLGFGLGGPIFGKRTRIPGLKIGRIYLPKVNVSFPDEDIIERARFFRDRDGSLGGDFLKRFTVTFDFRGKSVRFKKNRNFKDPFRYNMSGLTLESEGKKWNAESLQILERTEDSVKNRLQLIRDAPELMAFHYTLLPKYKVTYVRKGSVADKAGIKAGDKILSVNGKAVYHYKLYQLMNMFFKNEGDRIKMKIEHNGNVEKVSFRLKRLL